MKAWVPLDADRMRAHYLAAYTAHRHRLRELCHGLSVPVEMLRTDEDLAQVLVRVLAPREGGSR